VDGANVNATSGITAGTTIVATGNITGGNLVTLGNVDGANLNATAGITAGTTVIATGNVSGGNVTTAGNIDGANVNATAGITAGTTVVAIGNVSGGNLTTAGNIDGANVNATAGITAGTTITATGNVSGGNLVTTGTADLGNIRITGDDITNFASNIITINSAASDIDVRISGDTVANLLVTDAGTDTVVIGGGNATTGAALKVDTTDSMMVPVGNTIQRPGTPEVGMFRFNTGGDALEVYTSSGWEDVGVPAFTVIIADAFVGDGSTLQFTLSANSTTAGTIVAINGVVQEPTTAYSVSSTTLTFTEAPAVSDNIDARILTTTTTVTQIENVSGNAVVEVLDTADTVQITGNLLPQANVTFDLGSTTLRWRDGYFAGNSITLGNTVLKNTTGNSIGFFGPDGATPATIDAASVDTTQIASGTSSMAVIASGGNIRANVGGAAIAVFHSGGIDNGQANGVGNIGTATSYFNTIFAQATSAQYADLAEMYEADAVYEPGTVLCFGGDKEVTLCGQADSTRVAGVVSTNPSYLMNSGQTGENVVALALTGRVPCRVTGTICKGDLMVSTGDGRARANNAAAVGTVIGKSLADFDGADGVIEVVVGRV
jgi:filamentous hemagglutinin